MTVIYHKKGRKYQADHIAERPTNIFSETFEKN